MKKRREYIALHVHWNDEEWVRAMSPAARLAWIELLCWVAGSEWPSWADSMSAADFARMRGLRTESVLEMLGAAISVGELESKQGYWYVPQFGSELGETRCLPIFALHEGETA
jgi:hypothetical protein